MPLSDGNQIEVEGLGSAGTPSGGIISIQGVSGGQAVPVTLSGSTVSASYLAVFDRIAPAQNKYMATLWNGASGRKVVVQRVWVYNWQITAVSGVYLEQEMRRITARTAGTTVTPVAQDTNDTLTSGIAADHNSSAVTDSSLLRRVIASSEELALVQGGPPPWTFWAAGLQYERMEGTRGIVLRQNQGLTIKNITNSTVGSVSYVYEFTDEAA